ncbi:MAG: DivIVA domain-containing protein, partial [Candidatus Zixiibacteriota bacterium]
MDLSPNDIRNQEFSNKMRGYDKEDVDNFLEKVAEALENARQENLKLSMEIDSLNTQITGLKQFEDTIKNAAIDARRNADLTIANAKKEADLILSS